MMKSINGLLVPLLLESYPVSLQIIVPTEYRIHLEIFSIQNSDDANL